MSTARAIIAIVDDDAADRLATRRAFAKAALDNELLEAVDGARFLALLDERRAAGVPLPDLILLDLKMPGLNGHEVMARLRAEPDYAEIPVVVLTVSDHPEDIRRSYLDGATSYIPKPVDLAGILRVVAGLDGYALSIIRRD